MTQKQEEKVAPNDHDLHLVDWLRRIQLAWELDLEQLSRVAHVPQERLEAALRIPTDELQKAPSVPSGLEPAVALVGLYRQLLTVYPTAETQNHWLKAPNHVFEGHRPIDVITMSPEHLAYAAYSVETGLRLGPKSAHSE
jgi:hypothetical protein